jgi:hypothetical protein
MIVTKNDLAGMLLKYINHEINLYALVNWAEKAMMDADFEKASFNLIRDITARLGLADVREFGLSWDDCYDFLKRLGYAVKVELIKA